MSESRTFSRAPSGPPAEAGGVLEPLRALREAVAHLEREAVTLGAKLDEVSDALQSEKARNRTLSEQLARLEAGHDDAHEAKQDFLAIMSHELRTPLNGILGMAELLAGTPLSDEQLEYVATVKESGANLLAIVQNVLDYSELNSERSAPDRVWTDLEPLLAEVSADAVREAFQKGLQVYVRLDPNLPAALETDPTRLQKILECLLSNAVKFTISGSITLHATVVSEHASRTRLRFAVSDTGVGIDPAKQARIFDLFYQADTSDTRAYGGTGIGLALARQLVRSLGGELEAISAPGAGSRFSFEIEAPGRSVVHPAIDTQLAAGGFAAITDDPAVRARIEALADRWRLSIPVYATPEAIPAGTQTPIVLVDLPAEDAAIVHIMNHLPARVPVVGLSRPGQWIPAELRGRIAATVTHPVWAPALLDALRYTHTLELERRKREPEAPPALPEPIADSHLLLVDQHPVNQRIVSEMLRRLGCRVTTVASGAELAGVVAAGGFDAVLINANILEPDGCTAAIRLRETLGPATPPLFAIGMGGTTPHTPRFASARFDGTFAAPFTLDQMKDILARVKG